MLTVLEGNRFLVADALGNITQGAEGLYSNDTRFLSRWRLLLDGRVPRLLSSGTKHHASAAVYLQPDTGSVSRPSPLAAIRELFVSEGAFQERLVLENHGTERVASVVRFEFDADFLDLFEVKSQSFGERDLAFVKRITPLLTARDYDDDEHVYTFSTAGHGFEARCLIWFSEPGIPGDREVHFEVEIDGRSTWSVDAHVVLLTGPDERRGRYGAGYFGSERERVDESLRRWDAEMPLIEGNLEHFTQIYRRSLADLAALRMRTQQDNLGGLGELPAAGLPWFMTVFGRDTLLTSFQVMPLGQGLARTALRVLAQLQSQSDDPERDAEPGKVLHEMRFGKVAALTGQFPYYGSVDSTPLYLILLSEVWRWSGDDALVRELEGPARRALEWIERYGDLDGDGFLEFQRRSQRGLVVQSWKDSWDAMQFADGRIAAPPIAPAEVQGYAYAARVRTAELARAVWGDEELAERLEADAATLRRRFDEAFWVERDGRGYYALALDAEKRQVDGLASNAAHLLFTGIALEERLPAVVAATMSDALFSGWGVRTLAADSVGYNPIGYHTGTVWPHDTSFICYGLARCGYREEAMRLGLALAESAEHFGWRLPEVIAGYPRDATNFPVEYPTACSPQAWASAAPILCLRAMLGLEPDRERRTLRIAPMLPMRGRAWLRWEGVHAFGRRFRVIVVGDEGRVD